MKNALAAAFVSLCVVAGSASAEVVMAKVVSAEGGKLTVSAGSASGVAEGQSFTIYGPGKVIRIPLTDTVTYEEGKPIAQAKAVRVSRDRAELEVTFRQGAGGIAAGMDAVARIVRTAPIPTPAPQPAAFPQPQPGPGPAATPSSGFSLRASSPTADPGGDVVITATGHGPGVSYSWKATAGSLSLTGTAGPRVEWSAPRKAGSVTITAVRNIPGGAKAEAKVTVKATGAQRPLPKKVLVERMLGPGRFGEGIKATHKVADVTFDEYGYLYMLDGDTNRVYAIDQMGACVKTFPREETGAKTLQNPVAVAAVGGKLYVADAGARMIKVFRAGPGGDGKFLKTMGAGEPIDRIVDIAVDPKGNVYLLDYDDRCVHVFDPDGSYRLKFGRKGSGRGDFLRPIAIECDVIGNVYVLDAGRKNFQVFDKNMTFKGEASIDVAGAGEPLDMAVRMGDGRIEVLHGDPSPAVITYDASGVAISNSLQKMSVFPGLPSKPGRIAADARGASCVSPRSRRRLYLYSRDGRPEGVLTDKKSGCRSIAISPSGMMFGIADKTPLLRVWNPSGWLMGGFVDSKDETYGAPSLSRVAASGDGSRVFALDPASFRVMSFTPNGKPVKVLAGKAEGANATPDKLRVPRDLVAGPGPTATVLDAYAYGYRAVNLDPAKPSAGETKYSRGRGNHELWVPWRMAVDTGTGEQYVYDYKTRMIKKYHANGGFIGHTGGPGTAPGQFAQVERMVVGSRGELWIYDSGRGDIQRMDFRGKSASSTFVIARGQFDGPIIDIGVDGRGRLYVLTGRDSVYVFTQQ